MRKWFKGLSDKKKKIISISLTIIGIIFCCVGIENYYLIIPGLVFIVPGIIFVDWYNKDKKEQEDKNIHSEMENNKQKTEVQQFDDEIEKVETTLRNEKPNSVLNEENFLYTPPEGFELVDWTYATTLVRGCSNYIDEDYEIDIDSEVEIIHEPTDKYPENTSIYIDNDKVGSLKQDMAIEWYQRFGSNYNFIGRVVEYEQGEYPRLLIEIKKPIIRKIKKKQN